MDGRVDGVKLDVIDAKAKDAGAHIAEARHLEAGDERRAVMIHNPVGCSPIWPALVLTRRTFVAMVCDLRAWLRCVASFSRDYL